MGSTAQATNWAGSTGNELLLFPWGQGWEATGEFTNGLHQVFASLPDYDPTLGQYVPLFRRYAPTQGRWLTPDPLGGDVTNPQSLNRYAYVLNNPASFTDPLGLCSAANPDCHQPCQIGSCREPGTYPPQYGYNTNGYYPWNVSQDMLAELALYLENNCIDC